MVDLVGSVQSVNLLPQRGQQYQLALQPNPKALSGAERLLQVKWAQHTERALTDGHVNVSR